jgi:hypothetical protein
MPYDTTKAVEYVENALDYMLPDMFPDHLVVHEERRVFRVVKGARFVQITVTADEELTLDDHGFAVAP